MKRELEDIALHLRESFDLSFGEAPRGGRGDSVDVVSIRIEDEVLVIPLGTVSGLHAGAEIVPIPTPVPELLGLATVHGIVVPIYDLAALLGYRPSTVALRWCAVARAPSRVGFAFEGFEAHARVTASAFAEHAERDPKRRHVRGAVRLNGVLYPLLDTTSLLEAVASKQPTAQKDR